MTASEVPALPNPADTTTWPEWKKNVQIWMVAFHAMMCTFMGAGLIPGFVTLANQYKVTIEQASYLTAVYVCANYYPMD